jgi:hypothetical protein
MMMMHDVLEDPAGRCPHFHSADAGRRSRYCIERLRLASGDSPHQGHRRQAALGTAGNAGERINESMRKQTTSAGERPEKIGI